MYKKLIASLMAAIMTAITFASPALSATALNTYPTFLGKSGDFYVVVGANAATADVAGAIDIASNLAQLSYKDTSTTGSTTSGLDGVERKIAISTSSSGSVIGGSGANNLPSTIRNFHYSGLKEAQVEFKGTKYNYHEAVILPTTGTGLILTHALVSPINGTLKMRVDQNALEYRYIFDSAVPAGSIPTSANSTSYSTPLVVTVAGTEFRIVAIPSTNSFIALVGSVGWVTQGSTTGVTAGDLTAIVDTVYSGTQAAVRIVDSAGNTATNLGVVGTTTQSFSYGGSTYNLKVLQTATVTVAGAGENRAQILFGEGDIEKTFDGSTASTISAWGTDWKVGGNAFGTDGGVASGSYIKVTYYPDSLTDATRYFLVGSTFKGPGNYFELKYSSLYPGKFAKVTIEPSGTITYYNSTAATGYETDSLQGLKFSSDVSGTLVYGSTGYDEMYLLFNESDAADNFNGTRYLIAYKDKVTQRVINLTVPTDINSSTTYASWKIDLSYGGPGATSVFSINGTFTNETLLPARAAYSIGINSSASALQAAFNYTNRTVASTSLTTDFILGGNSGTADANDVKGLVEGSISDVATQVGDVLTDGGVYIYSIKSNAESNKVVVGIPPEVVYGVLQFGKIGPGSTSASGTVKEVVAITTAVAKLDSEITATDKTTKNFVLVGGPCVNTLTADLVTSGKLAGNKSSDYACTPKLGAAWTANTGYIIVVDDGFATGKKAVVVAGTAAADTRLASTVLQQYATKLTSITASSAKISGTAIATATIA